MSSLAVSFSMQADDGRGMEEVILINRDGHTWWHYVTTLPDDDVLDLVFESGCRSLLSEDDPACPAWFWGVDLVELRSMVLSMLMDPEADRSEWWPTPAFMEAAHV